jgi:hypothetical protein
MNCIAQLTDTIQHDLLVYKYDTSRITDFSDKFAVYFNISGKVNSIDIQSNNSENQLELKPNGQTTVGFGFDYKWIGLGTSFSLPFMNKDDEIYGETERYDFQINYYRNSFGIDAYMKYYKGFYLVNPYDFTEWNNTNFPILPGMETFATGISGYYVFNNKNFSYKAAFPRTMWQKKSSGSWLLGAYLNWNVCNSPDGVFPAELPDSLAVDYDVKGFSNTNAGIAFGYTYTWVIKKRFFTNLSVVPGIGYARPEISTSVQNKTYQPGVSVSITSRLSLGYEGKQFYYGFNLVSMVDSFNYEKIKVSSTTGNLRIFIGRRFDVSKLFKHK